MIVIKGLTIHQDAEGRYCLNDLHKAAGSEEKDSPSRFSRTEKYNELLTELTRQNWRVKPSLWLDTLQNRELVDELISRIPEIKPMLTFEHHSCIHYQRRYRTGDFRMQRVSLCLRCDETIQLIKVLESENHNPVNLQKVQIRTFYLLLIHGLVEVEGHSFVNSWFTPMPCGLVLSLTSR